jgi:hypothetical protein
MNNLRLGDKLYMRVLNIAFHLFYGCLALICLLSVISCSSVCRMKKNNHPQNNMVGISCDDAVTESFPVRWREVFRKTNTCPTDWVCSRPVDKWIKVDTGGSTVLLEYVVVPKVWFGFRTDGNDKKDAAGPLLYECPNKNLIVFGGYRSVRWKLPLLQKVKETNASDYFSCWKYYDSKYQFRCSLRKRCRKKPWQDEALRIEDALLAKLRSTQKKISIAAKQCFMKGLPCARLFRNAIKEGNRETRLKSLYGLSCLEGHGFVSELKALMFDPDMEVAKAALRQIGLLLDRKSMNELIIRFLKNSTPGIVRNAAIHIAGNAQIKDAMDIVKHYLQVTRSREEIDECVRYLGLLGNREVIPEIIKAKQRAGGSLYYENDALARLSWDWGEMVDGYRLHLEFPTWQPTSGKKADIIIYVDIRDRNYPVERIPALRRPRNYELLLGGNVIGRIYPSAMIHYSKYNEIEEIHCDVPIELFRKISKLRKHEVQIKMGRTISNIVNYETDSR